MLKPLNTRPFLAIVLAQTLFGLLVLGACSPTIESYPSLVNQGILPLHTTNPYLGANLFLSREAENSQLLYHFLERRGGPTAIEIIDEQFAAPRLLMFYPRDKEVYVADLQEKDKVREWVVRAPYAMGREDFRKLQHLDTSFLGEPVFIINNKTTRFRFERPAHIAKVLTPVLPTPAPTPKHPPKKKVAVAEGAAEHKQEKTAPPIDIKVNVKEFKPLNTDQQALMMAKGYAERADNGDLIHTVKGEAESLELIAKWYTGSPTNAAKLALLNGIPEGGTLISGQRVRVPLDVLHEVKAMPGDYH